MINSPYIRNFKNYATYANYVFAVPCYGENNMISLDDIATVLDDTFSQSLEKDLGVYFSRFKNCKTWFFSSDYCIGDKNKPNDVITFSIYPYLEDLHKLCDLVKSKLPCDIKKTREVGESGLTFLRENGFIFNISFIIVNKKFLFSCPNKCKADVVRECLTKTMQELNKDSANADYVKSFQRFYQKAKSNNFNVSLFENMYITSFLAAYISRILSVSANASKLCWFGDRDAIMEYGGDIIRITYDLNYWGLLRQKNYPLEKTEILGIGMQAKDKKELWYDELVRISDYIAGTLASWDLNTNLVDKPKHGEMLENVFSDNSLLGIIRLNITEDGGIQASRITVSKSSPDKVSQV